MILFVFPVNVIGVDFSLCVDGLFLGVMVVLGWLGWCFVLCCFCWCFVVVCGCLG